MHDKTIRRRRAVLALLVVISLILLTDYFGESPTSPLHSVQRGIVEVLSPIQEGASKVLSPVRSAAHWVSSTFSAKSQLSSLTRKYDALETEVDHNSYYRVYNRQLRGLLHIDDVIDAGRYGPVTANVIGRDPEAWYDTIELDQGSDSGVRPYDPVIGPGGLVGDVSAVGPGYSWVTLVTSPKFAVGAMVEGGGIGPATDGDSGVLKPAVGNPNVLILSYLPSTAQLGSRPVQVVTSGFKDSKDPTLESWAPPGIPIGLTPGGSQQNDVATNQQVDVEPSVNLSQLSVVRILTNPRPGS